MWAGLLAEAYTEARFSPDPSSHVGALVCTIDGVEVSQACNTFTPGIESTPARLERPLKYDFIEHAERGAIYNLVASGGVMPPDAVMVAPWAACVDCARAIVQSGIRTLVRHNDIMRRSPPRWLESISLADTILEAGGVQIEEVWGPLGRGNAPILHCGEEWTP